MPALIDVPIEQIDRLWRGTLGSATTPTGIEPLRAAEHAFSQMTEPFTREVFRMTSGVRLAVTTEATVLEVDVVASRMRVEGVDAPAAPAVFDLVAGGRDHASAAVETFAYRTFDAVGELVEEVAAAPVTLRFDGLPPRTELELWFPANAAVELRAIRADAPVHPSEDIGPRWVHYGSSISHCVEAERPTQTWPAVAARLAGVDLVNVGVAGNCHLDPFVARAIRDAPATCISLKVGINIAGGDTLKYRTFVPAVHGFLDTVRDGHPQTPILVISPIVCPMLEAQPGPVVPDGDGGYVVRPAAGQPGEIALSLVRMRAVLEEIVARRAAAGENIHYLDGLRLFGEPDLADLPDGVHPSPAGYIRIGERFADAALESGFFSSHRAVPESAT